MKVTTAFISAALFFSTMTMAASNKVNKLSKISEAPKFMKLLDKEHPVCKAVMVTDEQTLLVQTAIFDYHDKVGALVKDISVADTKYRTLLYVEDSTKSTADAASDAISTAWTAFSKQVSTTTNTIIFDVLLPEQRVAAYDCMTLPETEVEPEL